MHQLCAIHIPTKVTEALKDLKWVQTMKKEMEALKKKIGHGNRSHCHKENK